MPSLWERVGELLAVSAQLSADTCVPQPVRRVVTSYASRVRRTLRILAGLDVVSSSDDESDVSDFGSSSSGSSSDEEWVLNDSSGSSDNESAPLLSALLPLAISGYQAPWVAGGGPYPFPYDSLHCPPCDIFDQRCNCANAQRGGRCITAQMFKDFLDEELATASTVDGADGMNCPDRRPNNEQRKRCYREVARDYFTNLHGKRRRLPHCIVAAIRAVWPSETGIYMGFKLK